MAGIKDCGSGTREKDVDEQITQRSSRVSMHGFKSIAALRHFTPDGSQYESKPQGIQRQLLVGMIMEKVWNSTKQEGAFG